MLTITPTIMMMGITTMKIILTAIATIMAAEKARS